MAEMEYKFRLAGEERSRLWELEKMEIASRNDFMRSEQKRIQEQNEFDVKLKRLIEMGPSGTGQISQAAVDKYVLKARLEQLGVTDSGKDIGDPHKLAALFTELETNPLVKNNPELSNAIRLMLASRQAGLPLSDRSILAPVSTEKPQTAVEYLEELEALARIPAYQKRLQEMGTEFPAFQEEELKELTIEEARQFLIEADGDRAKAEELATQRGYKF
jgi:hypothetical protein